MLDVSDGSPDEVVDRSLFVRGMYEGMVKLGNGGMASAGKRVTDRVLESEVDDDVAPREFVDVYGDRGDDIPLPIDGDRRGGDTAG